MLVSTIIGSLLFAFIVFSSPASVHGISTKDTDLSTKISVRRCPQQHPLLLMGRGGATIELEEDDDEYEEEDESDDEIVKPDPKLTKSTKKSITKTKKKMKSSTKEAISQKLKKSAKLKMESSTKEAISKKLKKAAKKKRGGSLFKKIPYIIRASLNPVTLLAMTRAYFGSLFNLNFLKKDESQDLRSAMDEKAKKKPIEGRKRKRQFKPGQAKTLSDLPVLSA